MTPPRDPFLRAVYRVGQCRDLTPTERMAMLALWRFLGDARKKIGPALLADLISTTPKMAKHVLFKLKAKGYIASSGRQSVGGRWVATRWLTSKVKWPSRVAPTTRKCGRSTGSAENSPRVAGATTDLGVRQAATSGPHGTDMAAEKRAGAAAAKTSRHVRKCIEAATGGGQ